MQSRLPFDERLLFEVGLLAVQAPSGLRFLPHDDVALLMPEFEGRITVVSRTGEVSHRPGPVDRLPIPGMTRLADGVLGRLRHGRRRNGSIHFAGGWSFPDCGGSTPRRFTRHHPRLVASDLDLPRLRSVRRVGSGYEVRLDDGTTQPMARPAARRLACRLGLRDFDWIEPVSDRHCALYRLGLRDFPFVVMTAPTGLLRKLFGGDARLAIASLIWEACRHRAAGRPLDYGTEYRGFYYRPVLVVLNRLGLLHRRAGAWDEVAVDALAGWTELLARGSRDPHYEMYGDVLADMIGADRLLTYRDLGFDDPRPDLKTVGAVHADWLLSAEKASLQHETRRVGQRFGVSTTILGGMATLEGTEFLAELLRPALAGRSLKIVAYGDYDPEGYEIQEVLVRQLGRYGIASAVVGRLVLPSRFTRRELELVAEEIPVQQVGGGRKKLEDWMKRTHGVSGRPMRIHADHLRDETRVIRAFNEESGLSEVDT